MRNPRTTTVLISLNIIVFGAISLLTTNIQHAIISSFAFSTEALLGGSPWVILTSMFLHGSLAHLGLNMVALYFFGGAIEDRTTTKEYLAIYFIGGVAGNIFSAVVFDPAQLSIGASGAIFALMGAAMLLDPFEFVAYPWVVPIPILFVGVVMIVTNIFLFISPPEGSNISFAAHLGGFTIGLFEGMRRKGFVRGAIILGVGLVLLLLLSNQLQFLQLLDYTRAISTGTPT